MESKCKDDGLTRRGFIRTLGIGGMAASTLAAPAVMAQAPPAGQAATIPRRKLGKTGLLVSSLCLGGMFDTVNNQLLLRQAQAWGINLWDTAWGYGNGLSEEGFGRYFSRTPTARKEIVVITKNSPGTPDFQADNLGKALKRLNTDYVDVFCNHGLADMKPFTPEVKDWVAREKQAGRMKFFGFSTHTNMEDCLLAASRLGWIDVILFTYNYRLMHTPKMKEAVAACVNAGIGLVAFKSQGGGPVKVDSEAELQLAGRFLQRGFTDRQARLKAIWENPDIASICSQMPSLAILSANVAAARDLTALSQNDRELFARLSADTRSSYCAGCGRICQAAVGGKVPVQDVMRCLMYYKDYGDRDLARSVFAGLPESARRVMGRIDYGPAENACPHGLAIADLMREAETLLA